MTAPSVHFSPPPVFTIFCVSKLTSGLSGSISVPKSVLRHPLSVAASARSGKWWFMAMYHLSNHSLDFKGWTPTRRMKLAMPTPAKLSGSSSLMVSSSKSLSPCTLDPVPEISKLLDESEDIAVSVRERVLRMLVCQGIKHSHRSVCREWRVPRLTGIYHNADEFVFSAKSCGCADSESSAVYL